MINKDLLRQEFTTNLSKALEAGDPEGTAKAFEVFTNSVLQAMEDEFRKYGNNTDISVLQSRGLQVLTSEETAWYQKFIEAAKSGAKQEITNLTAAMPVTIIDRVIEDMKKEHPLLAELQILNAAGAQRMVMNGVQMASKLGTWGPVAGTITQELTGSLRSVDVTSYKYTAYFLIPKDFVKFNFTFAPMWVDQYVRIILSESAAFGLEQATVGGDGKDTFIGMDRDITSVSNERYSQKTAVALTDWEDSYAEVVAGMAIDANEDYRIIPEVLLVVNPIDYIKKVRKIQNTITPAGIIDMISHTYPTKVVSSVFVQEGKAIAGIAKNYFAAINGGQSGIIEYSDEYQFLEDNRVYTTRVYGYGRAIDNTSFTYLDISAAEAPALPVKVKGTVKTKEQA